MAKRKAPKEETLLEEMDNAETPGSAEETDNESLDAPESNPEETTVNPDADSENTPNETPDAGSEETPEETESTEDEEQPEVMSKSLRKAVNSYKAISTIASQDPIIGPTLGYELVTFGTFAAKAIEEDEEKFKETIIASVETPVSYDVILPFISPTPNDQVATAMTIIADLDPNFGTEE